MLMIILSFVLCSYNTNEIGLKIDLSIYCFMGMPPQNTAKCPACYLLMMLTM